MAASRSRKAERHGRARRSRVSTAGRVLGQHQSHVLGKFAGSHRRPRMVAPIEKVAREAMSKHHLRALIVQVTKDGQKALTSALAPDQALAASPSEGSER